ncbi:hypothetical protein OG439_32610 [Amycolatopsis sp. NBC_01307]|uniref:hypothetical protein n=1 Tax=Amycolatopsis sp. NBC_01307 TaxID=2903561 RepID=UPI002E15EFA5|nr:hypothetical protein OG439_32610 [Amycolatopsis sp. NBC_01307]
MTSPASLRLLAHDLPGLGSPSRTRWECRSCGARNRMRQRVCHRCTQNRPRR